MAKGTVLITGANRGIGFGFAEFYSKEGWQVLATSRSKLAADHPLVKLSNTTCFVMDVDDAKSITSCFGDITAHLKGNGIQLLINNAGIISPSFVTSNQELGLTNKQNLRGLPSATSAEELLAVFQTNVIGVLLVTQACLPLLKLDDSSEDIELPLVFNIGSGAGSIGDNSSGGSTAYRVSKCALNMLTKNFAIERKDIVFLCVTPGFVGSDMGNAIGRMFTAESEADNAKGKTFGITVEQSVKMMQENVLDVQWKASSSGKFFTFRGPEFPY